MTNRDAKFLQRVIVMALIGLTMGFGVAVFLTNEQLQIPLPRSGVRDILTFIAPLAALGLTGFGMTHRTFSGRGLISELIVLAIAYSMVLSAALPFVFQREIALGDCRFWQWGCQSTSLAPNLWWSLPSLTVGLFLFGWLYKRELNTGQK